MELSRWVRAAAPAIPMRMPARATADTLPQHQVQDAAARRAERLADGDLARALYDGIRDDAVETEHGEQRGDDGERAEQREHQAALIFGRIEDGGERSDFRDGLIVIEREDLLAHCVRERGGIALGAQHQHDGLRRLLRVWQIEAGHGIGVAALLMHGGGDANDLERLFMRADQQVLADRILTARILRPEAAGEALVDDGDEWSTGVVARGEGAAALSAGYRVCGSSRAKSAG